jgi:hypothetical protein
MAPRAALGEVVDDHVHELELVRGQGRVPAGDELGKGWAGLDHRL